MSLDELVGGPDHSHRPQIMRAQIKRAPANGDDSLRVVVPGYSEMSDYVVPTEQWSHVGSLPTVDAKCLLVLDHEGDAWIPQWGDSGGSLAWLKKELPPYVLPRGFAGDPAAQSAELAAAMAASTEVWLPPGVYPGGLIGASNTRIRGSGPGTIIIGDVTVGPGVTDFHLSDLTVLVGSVLFTGTTRCSVRCVVSKDSPGRGITFMGGSDFEITDNVIDRAAFNAIEIQNATRFSIADNQIDGGVSPPAEPVILGWNGIGMNMSTHFKVRGNRVRNVEFIGIALGNECDHASVISNIVQDTGGNGIDTGSCRNVTISGNEVTGSQDGIDIDASNLSSGLVLNISITGNTISEATKGNSGWGIVVLSNMGSGVTIADNVINRTRMQGICLITTWAAAITGNVVIDPGRAAPGFAAISLVSSSEGVGCQLCTIANNVGWEKNVTGQFGIFKGDGGATRNDRNVYSGNNMLGCTVPYGGTPGPNDVTGVNG